jgi:hypothetical protein
MARSASAGGVAHSEEASDAFLLRRFLVLIFFPLPHCPSYGLGAVLIRERSSLSVCGARVTHNLRLRQRSFRARPTSRLD